MALNPKKIAQLVGGIVANVAIPGAPLWLSPAAGLVAELLPDGKPSKADLEKLERAEELDGWERVMISRWVERWRRMLARPINAGERERRFEGSLYADFVDNYADEPEDKWIEIVSRMVRKSVEHRIATSSQGQPL